MTKDIIEKATEFSRDFEVSGFADNMDELLLKAVDFLHEELEETKVAIAASDRPEIIDGFGDVAFIALNGIYKEFRVNGESHEQATSRVHEVMNRICDANLGKRQADGTVKRVNGKVQKPEGWCPPAYDDMVA